MNNPPVFKNPNESLKTYETAKLLPSLYPFFAPIINIPNFKFSGWKFHIYSNSEIDVLYILQHIHAYVKSNKCIMKAALPKFFADAKPIQKGKGITIYLPFEIFKNYQFSSFYNGLQNELNKIPASSQARAVIGSTSGIIGDNGVLNSRRVFYRYELKIPFSEVVKLGGLNEFAYNMNYVKNEGGSYLGAAGVDLLK